jgi:hypothetical protein
MMMISNCVKNCRYWVMLHLAATIFGICLYIENHEETNHQRQHKQLNLIHLNPPKTLMLLSNQQR